MPVRSATHASALATLRSCLICALLLGLASAWSKSSKSTSSQDLRKEATKWLEKHGQDYNWSAKYRLNGVSYLGAAQRLRHLVQKLMSGEAVHMAAVGGSITWGLGVKDPSLAYPDQLLTWMQKSFPGAEHTMHNGALRGITSTYMALCLDLHLPHRKLDLVLAEFAVNDIAHPSPSFAPGSRRAAYERLLRKLLNLPGNPAVIVVNMFTVEREMKVGYWENAERDMQEFTTYYGLPTVSFKAATYHSLRAKTAGADVETLFGLNSIKHPALEGHVLTKEVIGTMLQQCVSDFATGFWKDGPGPLAAAVEGDKGSRKLPVPMIKNNYESHSSLCLMESRFKEHILLSEGWNWTDEGRGPGKWGYVSSSIGSTLVVEVDTMTAPEMEYKGRIWVSVAYLKSYALMGTATVKCLSGCSCDPLVVDAAGKSRQVSLTYIAALKVSQHEKCHLEISVGKKTATKGNKFKVMGVTISKEEGIKTKDGVLKHMRDESLAMGSGMGNVD